MTEHIKQILLKCILSIDVTDIISQLISVHTCMLTSAYVWLIVHWFSIETWQMCGNLTSISHEQLLRRGRPVGVFIFSWSDDIDAVGAL